MAAAPGTVPVLILKEGTGRTTGREAQRNNIMAGKINAGSGKTTLVSSFSKWIEENEDKDVARINLDPGADKLPYKPNFDIREFFTLDSIMKEENLGPNGALIRAVEKMVEMENEIKANIQRINTHFRLVDLPGQLEPFIFYSGEKILKFFNQKRTLGIFLIPAEMFGVRELVIAELLSLIVRMKFEIPTLNVLTKIDLIEKVEEVENYLRFPRKLRKKLEYIGGGVDRELVILVSRLLERMAKEQRIIKTSAKTGEGMKELYDICYEVFCACGDLS